MAATLNSDTVSPGICAWMLVGEFADKNSDMSLPEAGRKSAQILGHQRDPWVTAINTINDIERDKVGARDAALHEVDDLQIEWFFDELSAWHLEPEQVPDFLRAHVTELYDGSLGITAPAYFTSRGGRYTHEHQSTVWVAISEGQQGRPSYDATAATVEEHVPGRVDLHRSKALQILKTGGPVVRMWPKTSTSSSTTGVGTRSF